MTYRAFKRKSDGAWLSALVTTEKAAFRVPFAEHAAQVGAAYGLTARDVDVVEAATDPRVAPMVLPRQATGSADPLAVTLMTDIEAVAQANAVTLTPEFRVTLRRRLRERLEGRP